jgi:hypothetical protein
VQHFRTSAVDAILVGGLARDKFPGGFIEFLYGWFVIKLLLHREAFGGI